MIGSGAVESACETIVGQRLKQAGTRWRAYATDAVCQVRATLTRPVPPLKKTFVETVVIE